MEYTWQIIAQAISEGDFDAVSSLSWGIGTALGTSVAGKFIQKVGLNYIWTLTFVLAIIGAAGMFGILIFEKEKRNSAVEES